MEAPKDDGRIRVVIENVKPSVDGGRFAAKRVIGDVVKVTADIFTDGHDSIGALLRFRHADCEAWSEHRLNADMNDLWYGEFDVTKLGRYRFTVEAWVDHFETWRRDLAKRIKADQDTPIDYQIGADLLTAAAARASKTDAAFISEQASILRSDAPISQKREHATADVLNETVLKYPDRRFATRADREFEIVVDPLLGRYSAWYEFFPRSASPDPDRHGTFADAQRRLDSVAEMGFDIVYLPPIHPIGTQFRKGKNNATKAEPGDVGSPWAIGGPEGGHKSVHPAARHPRRFSPLCSARRDELGLQVALDIAFQVSPDHPYVRLTKSGSKNAPMARFSTRRTRRRSIRISIPSISKPRAGKAFGPN